MEDGISVATHKKRPSTVREVPARVQGGRNKATKPDERSDLLVPSAALKPSAANTSLGGWPGGGTAHVQLSLRGVKLLTETIKGGGLHI